MRLKSKRFRALKCRSEDLQTPEVQFHSIWIRRQHKSDSTLDKKRLTEKETPSTVSLFLSIFFCQEWNHSYVVSGFKWNEIEPQASVNLHCGISMPGSVYSWVAYRKIRIIRIKKLIVVPTTNLTLTLKSNTMKNSMQNYKIFLIYAI